MKRQILTIILGFATIAVFAQNPLPKGKSQINAGVGFSTWGIPVYLGFDYGIHPDISLGAEVSYRGYNDNWHDRKYRHSVIGVLGNAN